MGFIPNFIENTATVITKSSHAHNMVTRAQKKLPDVNGKLEYTYLSILGLNLFLVDDSEDSSESSYGKFCQEDFKLSNMLIF